MPAWLVSASKDAATRRIDGVDTMVVFASSATEARQIAAARYTGDSDPVWNAASVTELNTGFANWNGWVFRVVVTAPNGTVKADVSLTSTGASLDTIDEIGAALAVALNGTANIAGAAYDNSTNTLTVADASDDLGDHTLTFQIKPPPAEYTGDMSIASLVGTITHQGAANAALTVVLPADNAVIPRVYTTAIRTA